MPASEVVGQASLQDSVAIPEMLFISGGDFVMGSDPATDSDAKENEQPPHAVKIKDFHIGKYEVTFEEYDAFVKSTGRRTPGDKKWGRGQRPVINVSSEAATAYAEWLSLMTGKAYRLPTEAEWEYAARAGSKTRYWWGDAIDQDGKVWANYEGHGDRDFNRGPAPVGQFPANGFGLHDTAGNVWEWVQDCWHESYEGDSRPDDGAAWGKADDGPAWGKADRRICNRHVIRGGSWLSWSDRLRSAYREYNGEGFWSDYVGFRLAQDVEN